MNNRFHRCLTSLALLGLMTATAKAQTWSSVDVILPGPDPATAPTGVGRAVLINPFQSTPAPSLFVGVQAFAAGAASLLRCTPVDVASSAYTLEDLDSTLSSVGGFGYNPVDGALYAAGQAPIDPNARRITYTWKVMKSEGQGDAGTWSETDSFTLAKNAYASARKVAVDPFGKVFVTGVAVDGKGSVPHWIVRRKVAGGGWATVLDLKGNNINMLPSVCYFPGNAHNPTPAMLTTSDLNSKWTVMRSQLTNPNKPENLGALGTWVGVDSWTGGGAEAAAYDITCDPANGYLYVVGCRGLNGRNPSAWVIRTSVDGGNNWTTLLDVPGSGSWASMAAVDGNGNVSVSGVINPAQDSGSSTTRPLWKIIRCTAPQDPASWVASFADPDPTTLPFGPTTYSKGSGMVADPAGNVFGTGMLDDWTDTSVSPAVTYSGTRVGLLRMVP